jgi:hypothetical protein
VSRRASTLAAALFVTLLGATSLFLWHAHRLATPWQIGGAAAIVAGLWLVGRLGEGRPVPVTGYPSEGFPENRPPRG